MSNLIRLALVTLALVATLPLSAHALWSDLTAEDVAIAPPPKVGSRVDKKDFETLHEHQNTRTKRQCAIAASQLYPRFETLFGGRYGVLTKSEVEKAEDFMEAVFKTTDKIVKHFKEQYERPRPYNADPSLKPCIKKPGGDTAYPSQHAFSGRLGACLLKEIFPDKAEKIVAHGTQVGINRVLSGVHHPSDIEASWELADEICTRFLKDRSFLREIQSLN